MCPFERVTKKGGVDFKSLTFLPHLKLITFFLSRPWQTFGLGSCFCAHCVLQSTFYHVQLPQGSHWGAQLWPSFAQLHSIPGSPEDDTLSIMQQAPSMAVTSLYDRRLSYSTIQALISPCFSPPPCTRDGTQGLTHARQVPWHRVTCNPLITTKSLLLC